MVTDVQCPAVTPARTSVRVTMPLRGERANTASREARTGPLGRVPKDESDGNSDEQKPMHG